MPLTRLSTQRDVYEQCGSYRELLKHTSPELVARLANSIRNWKRRHALSTLDEIAFIVTATLVASSCVVRPFVAPTCLPFFVCASLVLHGFVASFRT